MRQMIKILFLAFFLLGCSVPSLDLFKSSSVPAPLLLPPVDSGYTNLHTRVITSDKEYRAFLSAIDTQKHWEHKITFGMDIAKAHINFRTQNLLIYRHHTLSNKIVSAKLMAVADSNATIVLTDSAKILPAHSAQVFFYKVSKKISKVVFTSKQRVVTVKNSRQKSVIPKECIAWFDGCNHCIRDSRGKALCTKRYCKKKDPFRCVKWQ